MRISFTLSAYVARQLLFWLAVMLFGIACLVLTLDIVEQLRKAAWTSAGLQPPGGNVP